MRKICPWCNGHRNLSLLEILLSQTAAWLFLGSFAAAAPRHQDASCSPEAPILFHAKHYLPMRLLATGPWLSGEDRVATGPVQKCRSRSHAQGPGAPALMLGDMRPRSEGEVEGHPLNLQRDVGAGHLLCPHVLMHVLHSQ